jgi:hypothetical protein
MDIVENSGRPNSLLGQAKGGEGVDGKAFPQHATLDRFGLEVPQLMAASILDDQLRRSSIDEAAALVPSFQVCLNCSKDNVILP